MIQDDKVAEIPIKKKELRDLILSSPEEAFEKCKTDKYFAIVRRSVIEELERDKSTRDKENVKKFKEIIDSYLERIEYYGLGLRDEIGDVLLADLIIERWRKEHDAFPVYSMSSVFTGLVDKLLENTEEPMVEKILKQSLKSMRDLEAHEEKLARQFLPVADFFAKAMKNQVFPELVKKYGVSEVLEFLYSFLLSNSVLRDYTMKQIAMNAMEYTEEVFHAQDEQTKFKVALFPRAFKLYASMPTPHLSLEDERANQDKEQKEEGKE